MKKNYDPKKVAEKIGFPLDKWPGNCYGVASACVKKGVVKGKPRYGHFVGVVAKGSMFYSKSHIGFARHGWVELPNGQIFDPTRYVFENVEPYIYIGDNNETYDIGGSLFRKATMSPPPVYDASREQITLELSNNNLQCIKDLLGDEREGNTFDLHQVFWIGNQHPDSFFDAKEVYLEFEKKGHSAIIPIDYQNFVLDD
jgi:hypothetical protein